MPIHAAESLAWRTSYNNVKALFSEITVFEQSLIELVDVALQYAGAWVKSAARIDRRLPVINGSRNLETSLLEPYA
jgi:hypothetical protein